MLDLYIPVPDTFPGDVSLLGSESKDLLQNNRHIPDRAAADAPDPREIPSCGGTPRHTTDNVTEYTRSLGRSKLQATYDTHQRDGLSSEPVKTARVPSVTIGYHLLSLVISLMQGKDATTGGTRFYIGNSAIMLDCACSLSEAHYIPTLEETGDERLLLEEVPLLQQMHTVLMQCLIDARS
ncbi:hypothetical protein EDD16DRAFT_1523099 [Pisolithus croceorrhizus]|nr:hypothetical protein EDD16DRAFT_1523099 [Pisolithus croceorrhizus]KAI6124114.1 hypothetical protein EV401DRAFT_1886506 [Pisolithus croceorrhizus]